MLELRSLGWRGVGRAGRLETVTLPQMNADSKHQVGSV